MLEKNSFKSITSVFLLRKLEKEEQMKLKQKKINNINWSRNPWKRKKINKTRYWFFQKTNKIGKPLGRLIRKNGQNYQYQEWEWCYHYKFYIFKSVKKYVEQVYGNTFHNLNKMNKFFERDKVPKFTQENKIDSLNPYIF